MNLESGDVRSRRLPTRLIVMVFVAISVALIIGYWLFLRTDYSAIFTELKPAEAVAITAELDAKKIDYRLRDGGTTILVAANQADQAQVAIAGSSIPLNGGVGFELFNKSDIGVTDFVQRINYQRALQGELERTVAKIGGVESARVHLAIPERSLFRNESSTAKAAVELVLKPGSNLAPSRVAGIQRLIAFSVPELKVPDVVVVDANGAILTETSDNDDYLSPDTEERQAVERYYRARARAALEKALPGIQWNVRVLTLDTVGTVVAGAAPDREESAISTTLPSGSARRGFALRVVVATSSPLNTEDRDIARSTVASAIELDGARGDDLHFVVGLPSSKYDGTGDKPLPPAVLKGQTTPASNSIAGTDGNWSLWVIVPTLLTLTAVVCWLFFQRLRPTMTPVERQAMIDRLRAALAETEEIHAIG